MEIYVKIYLISIFSVLYLVFNHDFIIYLEVLDFSRISASKTAADDVIN